MNYIIWAIWVIKIAFNLIGKIGRFRDEVPEAIESFNKSRAMIIDRLEGGLTAEEAQEIQAQLEVTWKQTKDVIDLFSDVIPHPRQQAEV